MKSEHNRKELTVPVAIIGMGCFFPKSSGLIEYWRLISRGEDAITNVPESHWSIEDYYHEDPKKPDHIYCTRGGFLSPISFDPSEFGIPPNSLEATDSSQLLGLVAAKMAFEDAGYGEGLRSFDRVRTSVILGVTGTQELVIPLGARLGHPKWRKALLESGIAQDKTEEIVQKIADSYVGWHENSFPGLLGNVVAGRISNRLDLGGTNCVVDAACASSMSAIHLAIQELISGRSDMVVTGGVDTLNDIFMHMCFAKTSVLSATGDARPFSKHADGTVLGEGVGILLIKRLEDAEKDGDKIYAVIRSVGSSSDGRSQSIYAPRAEGQLKALQMAYDNAQMAPDTVELIETHGTGTRVGDQVEVQALKKLVGQKDMTGKRCALGSVKSMIGHTKACAGTAGLIKTSLSLYNKILPPTIKVEEPDPKLQLDDSPFYLNSRIRPWFPRKEHPRRAGVSAFGFGGSNFHAILEEYQPSKQEIAWDASVQIAAFSADSHRQLTDKVRKWHDAVSNGLNFRDLSAKALNTRNDFSPLHAFRLLLLIERPLDEEPGQPAAPSAVALERLSSQPEQGFWTAKNCWYAGGEIPGKIGFVFPGQGSQYVDMGRDLVCCFPEAFQMMETVNDRWEDSTRLTDIIYPYPALSQQQRDRQEEELRRTDRAQPAIGAVSAAMLGVLSQFGIEPDATCGHSYGELTALYAGGWIDLDTFMDLSVTRGRLMAAAGKDPSVPNGGMLAVTASLDSIATLIAEAGLDVVLANRNSPNQGIVSGSEHAIELADQVFRKNGFRTKKLPVAAAFHSPLVKDAQKPFQEFLETVSISPTDIPVMSNTTGTSYPGDVETARSLLAGQILCPVDFIGNIRQLYETGIRTFVEVGPKTVLSGLVKSILSDKDVHTVALDSSSGSRFGVADLARVFCHLASLGYPVRLDQWERPMPGKRKPRMAIPISGTNYRSVRSSEPVAATAACQPQQKHSDASALPRQQVMHARPKESDRSAVNHVNNPQPSQIRIPMDPHSHQNSNHSAVISNALRTVQEGLKSMQQLQEETAHAHKKFLETQSEAGRTLQKMMESTRLFAEMSLGIKLPADDTARFSTPAPVMSAPDTVMAGAAPLPVMKPQAGICEPAAAAASPVADTLRPMNPVPSETPPPAVGTDRIPSDEGQSAKIRETILSVVSDLTGYPEETLELDMDIEADLGIDSIKRVEILSTVEERLPGLASIPPEMMGSLKTLREIVDYLGRESVGVPAEASGPAAEGPVVTSSSSGAGSAKIRETILSVVSDLTGYPEETLELDMDIEADLGIDSIKRVEILSTVEERLPGLASIPPEMMGSLKTLGHIIEHLSGAARNDAVPEPVIEQKPSVLNDSLSHNPAESTPVDRNCINVVPASREPSGRLILPKGRTVFVSEDSGGLSQAIVDRMTAMQIDAALISPGSFDPDAERLPAAGLILVAGSGTGETVHQQAQKLKEALLMAKYLGPELVESSRLSGAVLATITRLDGAFGFKGAGIIDPIQGGLAGLSKTASIEWDSVCCRALDISPNWQDSREIAETVVDELLNASAAGPVEIGLDKDARCGIELFPTPCPQGTVQLGAGDVVVVSGGARGVTAAAARALAEHVRPTLVLLGRSPEPSVAPEWLSGLDKESDIKKAIVKHEFNGGPVSPVQIERSYQRHMANRDISRTIDHIRQYAANVRYCPVDIRDADAVSAVMGQVRSDFGPVRAIIHGAGVLEDRLIVDKTPEQFDRVFTTKVNGLINLLDSTRHDPLSHIVMFSSVAARMGNKGQVDYAMANEVLNKIAWKESSERPECRVISINWGPWDAGMVSPALKREFERNGIKLIPLEEGVKCLIDEMGAPISGPVEVVIGAPIIRKEPEDKSVTVSADQPPPSGSGQEDTLKLSFKREIDIQRYPVLESHQLDGIPVVPFALITEWLAHGALQQNPGLFLHGLEEMRLLSGIRLDEDKKLVRLMTGKTRKQGALYEIPVEVRNGVSDGVEKIHYRARAVLSDRVSSAPQVDLSDWLKPGGYSRSIDEIYDKILFHGTRLRGIKDVIRCSSKGMAAHVCPAPLPEQWIKNPLRSRWIADPLILDSAFQMASLWCYEQTGVVSLPSYSSSYRQFCRKFPEEGIIAVLQVREMTEHKMKGDYTIIDGNQRVLAQLTGYEAVMDPSLNKAFKPEYARSA